jgi:peptidoglycan hydrolase-like protein with peptidoglycan-binding domain
LNSQNARKDPIAMLLNGETPVENSARILAVQKALIKAGFVLKADGVMRPSTRQALEGFERERKLPVTGEFNPRTLRELSQRTGIAIP